MIGALLSRNIIILIVIHNKIKKDDFYKIFIFIIGRKKIKNNRFKLRCNKSKLFSKMKESKYEIGL